MTTAKHVGSIVQTYGDENLIYGIVIKIGPKRAEVVWESGHHTRPIVGHCTLSRADFRDFSEDERAQIVLRLRAEQRDGHGPSRTPVFDGLCERALHGLDHAGQRCDLCCRETKER